MADLQPIARGRIVKPDEGDDIDQLWKHVAGGGARSTALTNIISAQARRIAKLECLVTGVGSSLHPFKIYQLPRRLRSNPQATDWRRVRVRTGGINLFGGAAVGSPLISVSGTDGAANPDIETYLDNPNAADILVSANTLWYFWVTLTLTGSPSATLWWGPDPAHGNNPANPDPAHTVADNWSSFPAPDATHQLIGWVDTNSAAASQLALVRQIARGDLTFIQSAGSSGNAVSRFNISRIFGDYYVCVPVGSVTATLVAKPGKLRNSIGSEIIDGVQWFYTYPHNPAAGSVVPSNDLNAYVRRTATAAPTGAVEYQSVIPRIFPANPAGGPPADTIYAIQMTGGTGVLSAIDASGFAAGTPVQWLDLNVDARAWVHSATQAA